MSDEKKEAPEEPKVPEGMTSTSEGVQTNEVVTQTPDQFYGGEGSERRDQAEAPKGHATKGMTQLGWTEASRLEDTAEQQERDRKDAERRAGRDKD